MWNFCLLSSYTRLLVRFITVITGALLLSACGAEGRDTVSRQGAETPHVPEVSAATPVQSGTDGDASTAQGLDTGTRGEGESPVGSEEEPTNVKNHPSGEEPNLVPENIAPVITDTSYNCNPAIQSVWFSVGDSDFFTLSVNDEDPLALKYAVDSSNTQAVNVSVDDNGIFTVTALQAGESYLWLTAEDASGLADEYELRIVIQD